MTTCPSRLPCQKASWNVGPCPSCGMLRIRFKPKCSGFFSDLSKFSSGPVPSWCHGKFTNPLKSSYFMDAKDNLAGRYQIQPEMETFFGSPESERVWEKMSKLVGFKPELWLEKSKKRQRNSRRRRCRRWSARIWWSWCCSSSSRESLASWFGCASAAATAAFCGSSCCSHRCCCCCSRCCCCCDGWTCHSWLIYLVPLHFWFCSFRFISFAFNVFFFPSFLLFFSKICSLASWEPLAALTWRETRFHSDSPEALFGRLGRSLQSNRFRVFLPPPPPPRLLLLWLARVFVNFNNCRRARCSRQQKLRHWKALRRGSRPKNYSRLLFCDLTSRGSLARQSKSGEKSPISKRHQSIDARMLSGSSHDE